jgi:glucose-1-phosphate cytidylyltransferase
MKVMILAGGMGTRLREHTEVRPKPMVEIGGRPILWHIMKLYAHHGFTDFIICLGYKANIIKEFFLNYESMNADFTIELGRRNSIHFHGDGHGESGWKVTLAYTGENAMTGSRIKQASTYLETKPETFCVTYGDGVTDVDLRKVLAFHKSHGKLATVTGVRPPGRFGELEVEGSRVISFGEKPQVSQGLINGGFFFFEPGFLEYLSTDYSCFLEKEPVETCTRDGQLQVYEHAGYWQCMDTYRDWENLEHQWQSGVAKWKVWT